MYFVADTLDDLLNEILTTLIELPFNIVASRGTSSEIFGVLIQLKNPRARLSMTETKGKPFSALGELLWYMTKSNKLDFIEYYISNYNENSDDGETIHGGYGPRLFNMHGKFNQVQSIIDLLRNKRNTRRAVIQLLDASDTSIKYIDIPCTCTLQFAIRDNKLNMFTSMRSNDAYLGLPHDIFSFTMLQEIIAVSVGVDIGIYSHAVGSLHLYDKHKERTKLYLKEGFQSTQITMPNMPIGDPWPSISKVMDCEAKIRLSEAFDITNQTVDNYWLDIIKLTRSAFV